VGWARQGTRAAPSLCTLLLLLSSHGSGSYQGAKGEKALLYSEVSCYKKIINRARIFHREIGGVSNSRVRPLNESCMSPQGEAPLRLAAEESLR